MDPGTQPLKAYIGLGANLGDREKNLREALIQLGAAPRVELTGISSFLENDAVGGPPGSPPFLNAVAEVRTTLSARDLLELLLGIERALGRERREKWGPRTIDLDLLLYGGHIIAEDDLTVPHPRISERRFVLQPLAELSPGLVVPGLGLGKTVAQLLEAAS